MFTEQFPRATLAENVMPSRLAFARAVTLGRQIVAAWRDRERIIDACGLDRDFGLPQANWSDQAQNDFRTAAERLAHLRHEDFHHLRLMAQVFSGYNLRELKLGKGTPSLGEIGADFDARWEGASGVPDVSTWRPLIEGVPSRAIVNPPHMLGEIGWWADGVLVNYDTRIHQERMTLLWRSGVISHLEVLGRAARILEIGAGYGALALALRKCLPTCAYVICDLPESLLFSALYLTLAGDQETQMFQREVSPGGVRLLPNYLFGDLTGQSFDLVINTLSMSEMSAHQVRTYAHGIARLIGQDGVFFEQNQDNRHLGMQDAASLLRDIFPHRRGVSCDVTPTQGAPNLWANVEAALEQITAPLAVDPGR